MFNSTAMIATIDITIIGCQQRMLSISTIKTQKIKVSFLKSIKHLKPIQKYENINTFGAVDIKEKYFLCAVNVVNEVTIVHHYKGDLCHLLGN